MKLEASQYVFMNKSNLVIMNYCQRSLMALLSVPRGEQGVNE